MCPNCGEEFVSKVNTQNELSYNCNVCNARVALSDDRCPNCNNNLNDEFWDSFLDQESGSLEEEDSLVAKTIVKAEDINVCCDKYWFECRCNNKIEATELYSNSEPSWYEDDTECMNCVYVGTPACPPLRQTYRQLKNDGEIAASITPCGSFKLDIFNR